MNHQAFPVPGMLNAVDCVRQLLHYFVWSCPRLVEFPGLASRKDSGIKKHKVTILVWFEMEVPVIVVLLSAFNLVWRVVYAVHSLSCKAVTYSR